MNLSIGNLCVCIIIMCGVSCKPKIYSFDTSKHIVTNKDSIHFSWKVRGKAELDYFQKRVPYIFKDSIDLLSFVLIAHKCGKASAPWTRQVVLAQSLYKDYLAVPIIARKGDTLIFKTIKDSMYREFEIISIASRNNRMITVFHGGKESVLKDSGVQVENFKDLDYEGPWQLLTIIEPEEKTDITKIPNELFLTVFIKPKNL
ncbi:MAG TPA: hypothetical protein VK772_10725 [Puia sp.]|jgi:hypothetical protein|nr:hypothetical protein [Puia sp.]